jgi:hypothetical protein
VQESATLLAINEGENRFTIRTLPYQTQLSCVCAIQCTDVNNDGNIDILMAGNDFEYKPQFSRLDASFGHVLLGDDQLNFNWQNHASSGFFIRDEVKHMEIFTDKQGDKYVIAAINNGAPKTFKIND